MPTPKEIPARIQRSIPLSVRLLDAIPRAVLFLSLCAFPAALYAQQGPPQPPRIPGENTTPTSEPDPTLRKMNEQMSAARNTQRQKLIVDDTAHLLQLAQQLNDEVSKSSKDMLSLSVVKKADEIEKLAKTIKDKMRDGE